MIIGSKQQSRWSSRLRGLLAAVLCSLGGLAGAAHAGYAAVVVDATNGEVLNAVNPDEQNHPASLTKMMTLYLAFQALQSGKLKLDQQLPVSAWAANKSPTKLDLRAGQTISVQDCIFGMITKSANDAATVVAESLGGSEDHFAELMTAQASRLGLTDTHFGDASGLLDSGDMTTARDMVKLAMALYHDYPQDWHYFATTEFTFRGQLVRGHNHLMDSYPGMDGLKTGFTDAAGFNIASTAVRDGHRLFAVVLGGRTASARDRLMARLLDDSFDNRQTPAVLVAQAGGATGSGVRRMLAALSPIETADAEPSPAAAPGRHHRRGKAAVVARACTPRRGAACTRRQAASRQAAAPHTARAAAKSAPAKLAHRRVKKSTEMMASTKAGKKPAKPPAGE